MYRFSICDLLWLTVLAALLVAWWVREQQLDARLRASSDATEQLRWANLGLHRDFESIEQSLNRLGLRIECPSNHVAFVVKAEHYDPAYDSRNPRP
jgi:hypothetical protein